MLVKCCYSPWSDLRLKYENKIWDCNKSQANALESVILGGARTILGCSSRTCNEAVRGDMGLDTLRSCRNKAKLKWWYKLVSLTEDRYPRYIHTYTYVYHPVRARINMHATGPPRACTWTSAHCIRGTLPACLHLVSFCCRAPHGRVRGPAVP